MALLLQDRPEIASTERPALSVLQHSLVFAVGAAVSLLAVNGRWDISSAAWIAPILLLRFVRESRPLSAIFGVVLVSAAQMGAYVFEMGAPFNAMTIALSLAVGALFATPYVLDRIAGPRLGAVRRVLLMPLASVAVEFAAASLLPVGASIGTRAITQTENLDLIQIISVFGPYAIGFLIALAATIANLIWEQPTRRTLRIFGGSFAALMLAVLGFGQIRLAYAANRDPGATVKVAGIVPPRLLHDKGWAVSMANYPASPETMAAMATPEMKATYSALQDGLLNETRAAAQAGAKIVMWSETAAPLLEADKATFLRKVAALAKEEGVYVNAAIGIPYERNETFLITPNGRVVWHYRKNHPVPGMEPVDAFRNAVPTTMTPFGRLANVICYDGDFPALMRVKADIMLVPGMDSPDTAYVHTMRMTRLRAIENGYSMVRTDFWGVSAAFDPLGRAMATQATYANATHVMLVDVPTRGIATLYTIIGDAFAWLCAAFLLLIIAPLPLGVVDKGYPEFD